MTFFVCFSLLLGFLILIKDSFIVYVNGSSNKDIDNTSQKKPGESSANEQKAPQHILDLEEKLDKQHKKDKEKLKEWQQYQESLDKEKRSKQDSSNVVNDASEPTPLTDLDGGD